MDRSERQVFSVPMSNAISKQLTSPHKIICFLFDCIAIVVKDLFSSRTDSSHRCYM